MPKLSRLNLGLLILIISFVVTSSLMVTQTLAATELAQQPQKYVNISLDVHGLEQSTVALKQASLDLASKLSQIDPNPENMTPEQMVALGQVIEQANTLLASSDQRVAQAGQAIQDLTDPTVALLNQSFTSWHNAAVAPTVKAIDQAVTKWLLVTILGLLLVVLLAGGFIYFSARYMRSIASTLKLITEDYEIVPKQRLAPSDKAPKAS